MKFKTHLMHLAISILLLINIATPKIGKSASLPPVSLISFSIFYTQNNVWCYWQTSSETNNKIFTVEKAVSSKVFMPIATITGAGNSSIENKYYSVDSNVTGGTLYYRLKQTDFDGTVSYSATKKLVLGTISSGSPVTGDITPIDLFDETSEVDYSSPLTIQSISFAAKPSGNNVVCTWQTETETSTDVFTLEKGTNTRDLNVIATIQGEDFSSTQRRHTVVDSNVTSGVFYYRLMQTDINGLKTYSEIKKVMLSSALSNRSLSIESVWPNSFSESFDLNYTATTDGAITLRLTNPFGKVVKEEILRAEKGVNSYQFTDNTNIPSGIYYLTLVMNNESVVKRVIKN